MSFGLATVYRNLHTLLLDEPGPRFDPERPASTVISSASDAVGWSTLYPFRSCSTCSRLNPAATIWRTMSATCFFVRSCGPCPGSAILIPWPSNCRWLVFFPRDSENPWASNQRSKARRVTSAGTYLPDSHDLPRAFRIRAGRPEAVRASSSGNTTVSVMPSVAS